MHLLTRPPLVSGAQAPLLPLDLHVLGLPPAFNLSHDQTLQFKIYAVLTCHSKVTEARTKLGSRVKRIHSKRIPKDESFKTLLLESLALILSDLSPTSATPTWNYLIKLLKSCCALWLL